MFLVTEQSTKKKNQIITSMTVRFSNKVLEVARAFDLSARSGRYKL